jgi:large subunit ribosomal protein L13
MKYKTDWTNKTEIDRKWYVIDVKDQILGRAATAIASLLIGKGKTSQVPNLDCGDYVIVVNSDEVKLSRKKATSKMYFRHSGFPGGAKEIPFERQMAKDSTFVIKKAVNNMLPNNKLRDSMIKRLFVYKASEHDHAAQKPETFNL